MKSRSYERLELACDEKTATVPRDVQRTSAYEIRDEVERSYARVPDRGGEPPVGRLQFCSLGEVALQQLVGRRVAGRHTTVDELSVEGGKHTRLPIGRDAGVFGDDADLHACTSVLQEAHFMERASHECAARRPDIFSFCRRKRNDSRHSLSFVAARSTPAPRPGKRSR